MFQPDNLTLARQRRGMKKTQLAKAIGLTVQMVTSYERGETEPGDDRIARLAEVLNFPVEFFFDDSMAEPIGLNGASFRALTRMTAGQRDSAIASGTFCIRLNRWIEDRFDVPNVDLPDVKSGLIDPEGAAALVRSGWGLGHQPIRSMLELAESHGVRVFALVLDCREVDAFSFWADDVPYVCLGTHKTPERAVFDLAHELGHLILHRDHAAPRGRAEEAEADAFASNLLMPREDIVAHAPRFPSLDDLIEAKVRWRVSVAALNYRMHKLGLISDWHYRGICIEIAQFGREVEPNSLRRDHSRFLGDVLVTMRDEGVRRSDIAKDINLSPSELDLLLDGLVLSVIEGSSSAATSASPRPNLQLVSRPT